MTLPFARPLGDVYIGPVVALSTFFQSPSAEAGAGHAPETPTAIVRRPEPGLARGVWEASPSFFYAVGGVIVVVAVVYALWRRGIVRFRRTRSTST
ncbi:hypothetical protein LZC95_18070 [Pendulispora brunnea]|uniref:Uncharacterized protein n=1 Tax=Pendulispora brunnea TaxID=2905690 RepID=A0ABZ2KP07_9BACT